MNENVHIVRQIKVIKNKIVGAHRAHKEKRKLKPVKGRNSMVNKTLRSSKVMNTRSIWGDLTHKKLQLPR